MIIKNGNVFIDGKFHQVDVRFDCEKIIEIGHNLKDDQIIDARGHDVYAGLVDTHMHGGFLRSFYAITKKNYGVKESGTPIQQIHYLLDKVCESGVTTVLPTLGDLEKDKWRLAVQTLRKAKKDAKGAEMYKLHFEGAYMNPKQSSAFVHNDDCLPTKEHLLYVTDNDLSDIQLVSIAPELEGSFEFIKWLTEKGIKVEAAYTKASADTIFEAAKCGLNQTTHMFNGFEKMHHRIDGPVVGCMLCDDIYSQITLDGYHVSKYWAKFFIKTKGLDHVYGISDLSSYSGIEEGTYHFDNGRTIIAKNGLITDEKGTIICGNLTMNKMMASARNKIGLTKEEVGLLYAENPAKCLDITDRGKIEVGRRSDFVIMDDNYNVINTIIKGEIYYENH